jgi:uncharacterized membrane protein YphA (DoxX/SURF4 family)
MRAVGRMMLASQFVYGGYMAAKDPGGRPKLLIDVGLPEATATALVRGNGAAMLLGGVALGLGVLPRAGSFGLAASLIPTTLVGHAFWDEDDAAMRRSQRMHFWKNVAMIGGLLVEASSSRRES